MLKQTFITILNQAVSHYLSLDPEVKKPLANLAGKRIGIEFKPFNIMIQGEFTEHGMQFTDDTTQDPDVILRGTPYQLFAAMASRSNRHQFFADDILIEGNVELGQQITDLFDNLHIDWEEMLSRYTGDIPAYHISKTTQKIKHWLRDANASFTANINDYLHEESNWLPSREALDDFFGDIDTLRMDLDRIEARIQQLQSQVNSHEVNS